MRSPTPNSRSILDRPTETARLDHHMQVVGDPEALPDAFFDALASLLLSLDHEPETTADVCTDGERVARSMSA